MNTKFNSWFWPDQPLSKTTAGQLRDEHNALVNSHQQLVEALNNLMDYADRHQDDPGYQSAFAAAEEALAAATATGHLKGVQK